MTAHVISDFARPNNFGDRFRAMVQAFFAKLDQIVTTDPDAYPM